MGRFRNKEQSFTTWRISVTLDTNMDVEIWWVVLKALRSFSLEKLARESCGIYILHDCLVTLRGFFLEV